VFRPARNGGWKEIGGRAVHWFSRRKATRTMDSDYQTRPDPLTHAEILNLLLAYEADEITEEETQKLLDVDDYDLRMMRLKAISEGVAAAVRRLRWIESNE
jgi:hypothetical protein